MRNKKGGIPDGLYLVIALFAVAIVFLFAWKLLSDVNNNMQDSPGVSEHGKVLVQESKDKFINIVDNAFLYMFIGLIMAIVIGAYFIRSHPALFWFSIPIIVFIVFLAAVYTNIFQEIADTPQLVNYAADFTYLTFIFDHFVYFFVGIIVLLSIALFAKNPEI